LKFRVAVVLIAASSISTIGEAQEIRSAIPDSTTFRGSSLVLVTSEAVDRLRLNQLVDGVAPGQSLLLRSASSLTPRSTSDTRSVRLSALAPQELFVHNTALPFSQNYGALWAGRGLSTRTLVGFRLETPRVRVIFAPELISSENSDWVIRPFPFDQHIPAIPPDRAGGGYVLPYYVASQWSIDQPLRFGKGPIRRFDAGQSTATISTSRFEFGFSNENEWWGPGIRNAIVLSNNAPGFPHFLIRTAHPLATRLGLVEARWLVGGLTESKFFDTVSTNNVRSLASIGATLQTAFDPNLSVGVARSVYSTATGWGQVPFRWFDVLARTADTGNASAQDPVTKGVHKDQLFSLFVRKVFPDDGLEIYSEWARTQLSANLRDFLTMPNHTQAYTLGLQWRRPAWWAGTFRLQTEVTQMEQSATFRDRPQESWYMSTRVIQGYTNRGEVIGASIGPGASSQWLAMDYIHPSWRFGAYGGRIRWNEDVHSTANFPVYVGYCSHDVSLYPGVRAASISRLGTITADVSFQDRENVFFENDGGCPNVGIRRDVRNRTLSISFSPFNAH
jgi:Capsule assembly protein Wzi